MTDSFAEEIKRIREQLDDVSTLINDLVADLTELQNQYEAFIQKK